jgi:hypothetical protein
MTRKLDTMMQLRRVFVSASAGMGVATALVKTFRLATTDGKEVARRILLGLPVKVALAPVVNDSSKEVSMLARLLAESTTASARIIGAKGETLSLILEKWLKMKEARDMERKVLQMRSHIMSAVLGAVVAMLATLGPLVSGLSFTSQSLPINATTLLGASASMVIVSSSMLGVFMSGRRFYVDTLVALAAFAVAAAAISPLANVPTVNLWGIG